MINKHGVETERRAYPRFSSMRTVRIELSGSVGKEIIHPIEREAAVSDISRGGARLLTDLELEETQILKLHLPIPGTAYLPPQPAEVRWVLMAPPGEPSQVGLRFLI
jgi:hypothetical protein